MNDDSALHATGRVTRHVGSALALLALAVVTGSNEVVLGMMLRALCKQVTMPLPCVVVVIAVDRQIATEVRLARLPRSSVQAGN